MSAFVQVNPVAKAVPFDQQTNSFVATDTQQAIEEARSKSGRVLAVAFTGTPKKATVTLALSFPSANYSVAISGADSRFWSVESITATGFVINSNANQALSGDVHWHATTNWS